MAICAGSTVYSVWHAEYCICSVHKGKNAQTWVKSNSWIKFSPWTKMEERWKLHRCKMVYRALNGQAPEYLTLLFNKSSTAHNYRTRASVSDGLLVPKAQTNAGKQSFSHSGTADWNQLPNSVRHAPSKQAFSAQFWRALHPRLD